jgi:hypothetical protein
VAAATALRKVSVVARKRAVTKLVRKKMSLDPETSDKLVVYGWRLTANGAWRYRRLSALWFWEQFT